MNIFLLKWYDLISKCLQVKTLIFIISLWHSFGKWIFKSPASYLENLVQPMDLHLHLSPTHSLTSHPQCIISRTNWPEKTSPLRKRYISKSSWVKLTKIHIGQKCPVGKRSAKKLSNYHNCNENGGESSKKKYFLRKHENWLESFALILAV